MTKPLTGDKLEIAILNAELRGFSELIDVWQAEAQRCARVIERVRELHKNNNGRCNECVGAVVMEIYPCPTIKALDGEQ